MKTGTLYGLRRTVSLYRFCHTRAETEITRNEVGVQMLNQHLHRQIFKGEAFPRPDPRAVVISKKHLRMHGLDPEKATKLPDIGFDLPPLQGSNIDEHFHRLGSATAQPWLQYSRQLSNVSLPPVPENWYLSSGWTKYSNSPHPTATPISQLDPTETMLVFDVETMPKYGPFAVMAIAASPNAWYSWISPWLLEESNDHAHLIPFGNSSVPRVVVGHNVSFDRARIRDEYCIHGTQSRFLDTMALHIAVHGMTSGQRPSWVKYNKSKDIDDRPPAHQAKTPQVQGLNSSPTDVLDAPPRWEETTAANSLAHVAQLHCGIRIDKSIRDDFLTASRSDIKRHLSEYLNYCASDVLVTHQVFRRILPSFLAQCPSPVSFGSMLIMGSSFLTVNETWSEYLNSAETKFKELEADVNARLKNLAENARSKLQDGSWANDVWLSQLDWSTKTVRNAITEVRDTSPSEQVEQNQTAKPKWFHELLTLGPFHPRLKQSVIGHLLRLRYKGHPVIYESLLGWHSVSSDGQKLPIRRVKPSTSKVVKLFSPNIVPLTPDTGLEGMYKTLANGEENEGLARQITDHAARIVENWKKESYTPPQFDPWLAKLDWTVQTPEAPRVILPKWYWQLLKPNGRGQLHVHVTIRSRIAPLLLKLSWRGYPLFHSREHGWLFRVPVDDKLETRQRAVHFSYEADEHLRQTLLAGDYVFYKLPHKNGEELNVGNPFSKSFVKFYQDETLTSPDSLAKQALAMNAQCSYWLGARDRVLNQMVVWHGEGGDLGVGELTAGKKFGAILPQVISMGTVTRRAMERTWLTASNAKSDRVGSELKAMVRSPPGYVFVGADVDSEELWISSLMGDAQFGFHGATAVSWMTLEGTKAAGTDLHSKTATILGITRDSAKVFNYSRIYGAGMRHAQLLLLQGNANMLADTSQKLAASLYRATKGKKSSAFGRRFWHGGSESFLFNKLESIAMSDRPETPALGCGVTTALRREHLPNEFGADYMPSRINWAVQSSGVDYLHLLITAMDHLIKRYRLQARYMISVHDEIRFLVKNEDAYRAAFALQVANLWTRCQFAFRLGMDQLPQGVAFFSAIDIDTVLRKEPSMTCQTPSHLQSLAAGICLTMADIMAHREHHLGSTSGDDAPPLVDYCAPNPLHHRSSDLSFLQAQATDQCNEVKALERKVIE